MLWGGPQKSASGRAVALEPRLSGEQRLIALNKGPDRQPMPNWLGRGLVTALASNAWPQ
jgi:hypothetical protein